MPRRISDAYGPELPAQLRFVAQFSKKALAEFLPSRHSSAEFVAFLTDIVIDQPRGKEIHVIADNQSAHKSRPVTDFLAVHPKVHLHFTPTYSSWLNQVEPWFGKIERDVITRGIFTSASDLKRKLLRYIRQYNKSPRTVKWKYADPSRHISTHSAGTGN